MNNSEQPAVIFVPGLGLDSREWDGVREQLGGVHHVVVLPSQGLPAPRGDDLSVEAQAGRLLTELDSRCAGRQLLLVGHSSGSAVAVEAAVRHRGVTGLVLIGPVTDPASRTWPQTAQRWLRTATHERLSELRTLVPQYARTGVGSLLRGHDAMRWYATEQALRGVDVPVAVLRGEHDRIPSPDWTATLLDGPDRFLTVVPGAAHMVPITHPGAVVAAIERVRAASAVGR